MAKIVLLDSIIEIVLGGQLLLGIGTGVVDLDIQVWEFLVDVLREFFYLG
jgi:hypothetical protein